MYWYIKYPLYVILVLALLGICGLLWRSCVKSIPKPADSQAEQQLQQQQQPQQQPTQPVKPSTKTVDQQPLPEIPQSDTPNDLAQLLDKAQQQFDNGMLEVARSLAERVLNDSRVTEFDSTWRDAADIINNANRRLMNSSAPCHEKERYVVVKGDSLKRIADKKYISVGNLLRVNEGLRRDDGRDPIIHPGQAMLFIKGVWSIRVVKHEYLLLLYRNKALYRIYEVSIGKENRTPAGTFLITEHLVQPSWWAPNGEVIPFGEPGNILGTRWLKLTPTEGTDVSYTSYGIHGTWDDKSIGTGASAGCVRMHNADVEELFDFIPVAGGKTPAVRVVIEE